MYDEIFFCEKNLSNFEKVEKVEKVLSKEKLMLFVHTHCRSPYLGALPFLR